MSDANQEGFSAMSSKADEIAAGSDTSANTAASAQTPAANSATAPQVKNKPAGSAASVAPTGADAPASAAGKSTTPAGKPAEDVNTSKDTSQVSDAQSKTGATGPDGKPGIFPSVTGSKGTPTNGSPADAKASTVQTATGDKGTTKAPAAAGVAAGQSSVDAGQAAGEDAAARPGSSDPVDPNSNQGPNATRDPAAQGLPSDPVKTGEGTKITAPLGSQAAADQAAQKHDEAAAKLNEGAVSEDNLAQGERAAQSGAEHNEAVSGRPIVPVATVARTNPLLLDQAIQDAQDRHGPDTVILPEAYHNNVIPADAAQRRAEAIARIAGAHVDTIPTPGRQRVPPNSGSEPEDQDTADVPGDAPVGGHVSEDEQARAIDKRHVAASQRKDMGDPAGTGIERAEKPVP